MSRSAIWLAGAGATFLIGCAAATPPTKVIESEQAAESPAITAARKTVPAAVAEGDLLKDEARRLEDQGSRQDAAVVAEQAAVAYRNALVIERRLAAEARLVEAKRLTLAVETELAVLDERQQKVTLEADLLEKKAHVLSEAGPSVDLKKMSTERLLARRKAAHQLTSEAKALCIATRLLEDKTAGLSELLEKNETLHQELAVGSMKTDLYPRAIENRNLCLGLLSSVRRPRTQKAPEAGLSDRLLTELTKSQNFFVVRDDRGVVVTLSESFDGKGELTKPAAEKLTLLAKAAREHAEFPVLIVVHSAKKDQDKRAGHVAESAGALMSAGGAPRLAVLTAGTAEPIVNPRVAGADLHNARVEVVFVAPTF